MKIAANQESSAEVLVIWNSSKRRTWSIL